MLHKSNFLRQYLLKYNFDKKAYKFRLKALIAFWTMLCKMNILKTDDSSQKTVYIILGYKNS